MVRVSSRTTVPDDHAKEEEDEEDILRERERERERELLFSIYKEKCVGFELILKRIVMLQDLTGISRWYFVQQQHLLCLEL